LCYADYLKNILLPTKGSSLVGIEQLSTVWSEWSVVEQIGEGSFGRVYKVVREEYGVTDYAAVKVISIPQSSSELNSLRAEGYDETSSRSYFENIVTDFVNEIKMMVSMKATTNIVSVEDYKVVEKTEEVGWDIFIRMELLTSFIDYTVGKKLSEEEVIKLGQDVCSALELCARKNIIHRDIKPENIFISSFGDFKVGDFGIARELEKSSGSVSMTTVGTYNYIAPEIEKSKRYDASVDTYSLGLVLFRLLNNNRLPFLDPNAQLITKQDRDKAVRRRLDGEQLSEPAEASPEMANLVIRACMFDPAKRFKSASEMKSALEAVKNGTYEMQSLGEEGASDKSGDSKKTGFLNSSVKRWIPATLIACVVLAAIVVIAVLSRNDNVQRDGVNGDGLTVSNPAEETHSPEETSKDNTAGDISNASKLEDDVTISFAISKNENMSNADFTRSLAIITERFQALTDTYTIERDDDSVVVTMLESDMGVTSALVNQTLGIITGSGTFTVYQSGEPWGSVELDKNYILSADVRTEPADFVTPDNDFWEEMREADRSDMLYIHVEVTNSGAEKIADLIETGTDGLYVSTNEVRVTGGTIGGSRIGVLSPVPGTDSEFYLILHEFGNTGLNNLVAAALTHFTLPGMVSCKIIENLIWEKTDEVDGGLHQVDDIEGDSVTLLYSVSDYYVDFLTDEDFESAVSVFRNRMDALGNPYAIGYPDRNVVMIAIKTSPERLGNDFISLISTPGDEDNIRVNDENVFTSRDIKAITVDRESDISYSIRVLLNDDALENDEKAEKIINNTIHFTISGVRVSSNSAAEISDDGSIRFDRLNFVSHEEMTENSKFILDLIYEIVNGDDIRYTSITETENSRSEYRMFLRIDFVDAIWDLGGDPGNREWGVNCDSADDVRIRSIIAEQFDGVTVLRPYGSSGHLNMLFDLEADDDLPQRFMSLVEEIFTVCGFADSDYSSVFFYNENTDKPDDRFRILFRRIWDYQIEYTLANDARAAYGGMYFSLGVTGSTFDRFRDEAVDLSESMEFFRALPGEIIFG